MTEMVRSPLFIKCFGVFHSYTEIDELREKIYEFDKAQYASDKMAHSALKTIRYLAAVTVYNYALSVASGVENVESFHKRVAVLLSLVADCEFERRLDLYDSTDDMKKFTERLNAAVVCFIISKNIDMIKTFLDECERPHDWWRNEADITPANESRS